MAETNENETNKPEPTEPPKTSEKPETADEPTNPEEAGKSEDNKDKEDTKPEEGKPPEKPEEEKPPEKPEKEKPLEPSSSKTIFDIVKDKCKDVFNNPYRMKIIACAIIFLFALEVARELKNIAFPLFLYKPFRKLQDLYKCLSHILCN